MSSKDRQIAELTETVARLEQKIAALSAACERGRVDTAQAQRGLNTARSELMRHGQWVSAWYYSPEEDWPSPDDRPLTAEDIAK